MGDDDDDGEHNEMMIVVAVLAMTVMSTSMKVMNGDCAGDGEEERKDSKAALVSMSCHHPCHHNLS